MGWLTGRREDRTAVPSLPLTPYRWAVVDVETSGLYPASHRVLSVAALALDEQGRPEGEVVTLVDGQCDPGPVHIHGLTPERLTGAPLMCNVLPQLHELLEGRVLVAHNAAFDYGFLASEAARASTALPVSKRLCTLALSRRLGLDVDDHRLGTLAAYWGVPQQRAHDAADDARVLARVFAHSARLADDLGLDLPIVDCDAEAVRRPFPASPLKSPCGYLNPGRLQVGGPLVQGMKVAITGETRTARERLYARMSEAGLDVMRSVSRLTSAVVSNDGHFASEKALRAAQHGIPVIDEATLLRLLRDVRAGHPKIISAQPASPLQSRAEAHAAPAPIRLAPGPMARRRVLVMGGTHEQAALVRAHVMGRGGSAAVNLSANVTDIIVLEGGGRDPRLPRALAAGVRVHEDLASLGVVLPLPTAVTTRESSVLPRGGVMDLPPDRTGWTVNVSWRADALEDGMDLDLVAFLVGDDRLVGQDEDLVFFNNPMSPTGAVSLSLDGASEQSIKLDLALLEPGTTRVVVAAAITGGGTFGQLGALAVGLDDTDAHTAMTATLDAGTSETTMLIAEVYQRNGAWRVRAVGQGYDDGLEALVGRYGLAVDT